MSHLLYTDVAWQSRRCQDEIHRCEDVPLVVAKTKKPGFNPHFQSKAGPEKPLKTRTFVFMGNPNHEEFG